MTYEERAREESWIREERTEERRDTQNDGKGWVTGAQLAGGLGDPRSRNGGAELQARAK